MTHICAHPDCNEEGTFPAPRDSRHINARQYFCKQHIIEFNKKWNGLDGMTEDEIFSLQHGAATWNRPTWGLGVNTTSAAGAMFTFEKAEDLYAFFKQRRQQEQVGQQSRAHEGDGAILPADVKEACVIFSVEPPFDTKALKQRYIQLVKKHHPDVNHGSPQAENQVKKINVAYRILTDYKVV